MEILDSERRRARNLIWNAAGDYHFEPEFKAFDENGRADLYWNSIVGCVRRNYGADAFAPLFESIHGCMDEHIYEQVIWLGLENAVYQKEAPHRPALPRLRQRYARHVVDISRAAENDRLLDVLLEAHYRRALGEDPAMKPGDRQLLDELELPGVLDGPGITDRLLEILRDHFDFIPLVTQEREAQERKKKHFFALRGKRHNRADLPAVRGFGYGFGEHVVAGTGPREATQPMHRITDLTSAQSEAALRTYISTLFGKPLYSASEVSELEEALCADSHKGCKLYYAVGDSTLDPTIRGYAGAQRKAALKQMQKNLSAYEADGTRNRSTIIRLTARIRNALMAYLQPTTVRSANGTLDAGRVWRGLYLNDDKVFTRVMQSDPGTLSVDILLDSSTSQLNRQSTVAAQGYMITEALTRCGIPVRVSSFCSLSGYTVLTRYRDYGETDKNKNIFHYFTTGCNRDGLAIRCVCREMEDSPCEHRMLILLSDAKPHDVNKIIDGQELIEYADEAGITNTAEEVRSLLHRNISVVCVFTGNDEDVPAAHTIYGRNFARIRSFDQFADAVGTLIQNQIRSL